MTVARELAPAEPAPIVMVVDDSPENLQLLGTLLRESGYRFRPVTDGRLAIQAAQLEPPDLILLDIRMPQMSGYEVCEQLQLIPSLRDVPVIFLSGLSETIDKVRAFAAGAVDYVTRPFQLEEIDARIRTHLTLRRQRRRLEENYHELRRLEELRDNLVLMIVHDLRTPLTGVYGHLQLMAMEAEAPAFAPIQGSLQRATEATESLIDMVSSVLDVSRMEAGELTLTRGACDLGRLAEQVLGKLQALIGRRVVTMSRSEGAAPVQADEQLIGRVIQNLLGNALKFTPDGGAIEIGVSGSNGAVRLAIRDRGPGIPPEYHERIFEKFGQAGARQSGARASTGLGLTFCKLAVEAHNGRIGVDSEVGKGSTFWFELPLELP